MNAAAAPATVAPSSGGAALAKKRVMIDPSYTLGCTKEGTMEYLNKVNCQSLSTYDAGAVYYYLINCTVGGSFCNFLSLYTKLECFKIYLWDLHQDTIIAINLKKMKLQHTRQGN